MLGESIRILLYTSYFQPAWEWGGPVASSWALATGLADAGASISVITTDARPAGRTEVARVRFERGVKIETAPVLGGGRFAFSNRIGLAPGLVPMLAHAVRNADLVHAEGMFGLFCPVLFRFCRASRTPYILSARGNFQVTALERKAAKKSLYMAVTGRRDILAAARLHYTTEVERDASPAWLRRLPSFVVGNAVYSGAPGDRERFRAHVGAGDDELVIGVFGRLHEIKGYDILLPALAAAKTRAMIRLYYAGPDEGGYGEVVAAMVRRLGLSDRVTYLGFLRGETMSDALAGIDLAAVPSHMESFGNVVAEATLQGTPVAVSRAVGLWRWVERAGVGVVVDGTVDGWRAALEGLELAAVRGRWRRDQISAAAREEFSPGSTARRMLAEYQHVLDERRAARAKPGEYRAR